MKFVTGSLGVVDWIIVVLDESLIVFDRMKLMLNRRKWKCLYPALQGGDAGELEMYGFSSPNQMGHENVTHISVIQHFLGVVRRI